MALDTNSNAYTFGYAIIMTLIVAAALALTAMSLKPLQDKSIALDKKTQILNAVSPISDKGLIDGEYAKRIEEVVVDKSGKVVTGGTSAFDLEIKKEYRKKKAGSDYNLPVYIYKMDDGKKKFIMPLHGAGLWDEIWGYVALNDDFKTIHGATFDHKGETPGLGAEIKTDWFQGQFKGKSIVNKSGSFEFKILKGKGNPGLDKEPHKVDGISGATITADGVDDMLKKGYLSYVDYFKGVR